MEYSKIVDWLRDYAATNSMSCFVVGVSGGIDSAVTSTLCAKTGYPTYTILLPIHQNEDHTTRGDNHIDWLQSKHDNVVKLKFDLTDTYESFKKTVNPYVSDLSLANTRARLRMTTLYQIAGMYKGLVVGTGNKVEDFGVGFYTKYGDGGVDISPIADLMKSQVYKIGALMGVSNEILTAPPTDGLWDDTRTDESQLGATYDELEWAMTFEGNISECNSRERKVLETYKSFNTQNKHKMVPIPVFNFN